MNATVLSPDPTRCPNCRAVLTRPGACGACGLTLAGPPAARLWEVDTELLRLDATRSTLQAERKGLLAALHGSHVPVPTTTDPEWQIAASPPAPRREWTPERVQNVLLALGGLLLAVAAVVFTAVTYDRLGAGGRAAVLVALTLAAGTAAPAARRRGLSATAETLGTVTLVLAALDAYGLRTLGLADDADPLSFAAASAAVLAAAASAYTRFVPLRIMQMAAVVLTQLPVLLLLARYDASAATTGLVLAVLAAADLAVLAGVRSQLPSEVRTTLVACGSAVSAVGLLASLGAAGEPDPGRAATALLAHAAVLGAAALLVRDSTLRAMLAGAPVPLVAVAAFALVRAALPDAQHPLVPAAIALLAALLAAQLPRAWRPGPLAGALLVSAVAVLAVGEQIVTGLLLPLTWLADPWSLAAGAGARAALGPGSTWQATVDTTVVLVAAALTVGAAALALDRVRTAVAGAAVLAAATVVLLPLGLDLPYPAGLALLLALAALAGGAAAALLPKRPDAGLAAAGVATTVALLAAVWSTADRETSLVVLPLTALLMAALSITPRLPARAGGGAVAVAGGLGTAALAATGAARELAADQIGGLLLLAVATLLGLAAVPALEPTRRLGAEIAAGAAALIAVMLAIEDAGWLSWVLAGAGLLALATALRPDRRRIAGGGALLLAASSWVRLADAEVTAPEPYVVPLAIVALVLGQLRLRAVSSTRSWQAYGPGLSLLLLPSLLACFDDDSLTRPLLLGLAALAVLLLGARFGLQAPLALGGAVLALDALQLLAPYAAALPRWVSLGGAGVLLVAIGATYEQRRRDVSRLRAGYDALD